MNRNFQLTEEFALTLDASDRLHHFRERFYVPKEGIYMDGNSLGLLSKDAEASLLRVLDEFKNMGINGWMEGKPAWFTLSEELGKKLTTLVGAKENEVIVTASATINLHNLVATFFKPTGSKNKILIDELNFPSDKYAMESQLLLHNLNPKEHLVIVKSRDGRTILKEDVVAAMTNEVSLVLLPSVLYRSGQLMDIEYLTKEAHKRGIIIGFDCCHSVGAVPHKFSEWGVDFASWCNYKYLNNGPGGSGALYVNEKHFDKMPGLCGWWGYDKSTQFDMNLDFAPAKGVGAWQISTANIFSTAPLEGSLNIFMEAGIENIREKSLHQTDYMMYLIDNMISGEPYNFTIGNPREAEQRGGHVALEHQTDAVRINEALKKRGVIPDFRYPNVMRLAPIALYTSYQDIWNVVQHLKEIMDNREYENFDSKRGTVA